MKSVLLTLALAVCFFSLAQKSGIKQGDQALFKECLNQEDPYFCTNESFKNLISKLITPTLTQEIKNSTYKDGLDISILFISDEQGKVIREEIEVYCENKNLQASARYLISKLPAFEPKSDKHLTRQSVHVYNLTFIPTPGYESYMLAPPLLTNKRIGYERLATYKNCEGDLHESQICFHKKVFEVIRKNVTLPETLVSYTDQINVFYLVNTDGSFILVDVIGGTQELHKETKKLKEDIKRAFTKIPPAQPALIRGIPTIQDFNLPVKTSMTIKNYYGN